MANVNQNISPTVQYVQSQSLYHSTLADDIREFDFTAYSVRDITEQATTSQVNVFQLYLLILCSYVPIIIDVALRKNTIV